MTGSPKTAAELIELALIDLMRTKAFDQITVKEITQHARVSRVSYYRNFSSKEEVLQSFIAGWLPRLIGPATDELPDTEVRSYLQTTLERIQKNAAFFDLLRESGLIHLLYGYFMREGSDYIRRFQPGAVPYQDTYYTGGTLLVIMSWIQHGMPESPAELAEIIDTLYYRRNF